MLRKDVHEVISEVVEPSIPLHKERKKTFYQNINNNLPKIPIDPTSTDFYVVLNISSGPSAVGHPCHAITGTDPNEKAELTQFEEFTLSIQAYGFDSNTRVRDIRDTLKLPSFTTKLSDKNLSIQTTASINDVPRELDGVWTTSSVLDIIIFTNNVKTEDSDIIETVTDPTLIVS